MTKATPEPSAPALSPSLADIEAAAARIAAVVRRTPVEKSGWLSELAGHDVYLKLECWQPTRSFKVRGAANAVLAQADAARTRGVVTASAGNHGQAVALAAAAAGAHATIFLPRTAPVVKRERILSLGARVHEEDDYDAAELAAERHAAETGALLVHGFSDPLVVAGQGTVGLELMEQLPQLTDVIVPAGGGGLINGIAAALRGRGRDAAVHGVQSERTPNLQRALEAGRLVDCPIVPTLADGLAGCTDERSLVLARQLGQRITLVREASIAEAMRRHLARDGVLAEGSAAVAAAALLERSISPNGPTALIITGGNVDPATLLHLFEAEPS